MNDEERVITEEKKKGRPPKSASEKENVKKYETFDGLPPVCQFRNVTEYENMVIRIYGDEEEKDDKVVRPGEAILLNEKDRRFYRTDARWLAGRIVPDSPEIEAMMTHKASNIMTEQQVYFLVSNAKDANDLREKISEVTSLNTLRRIREECGVGKQDKPVSWTSAIDEMIKIQTETIEKARVTGQEKQGHIEYEKIR